MKKIFAFLFGLTLLLSVVSTTHAAGVNFDLNLANLNGVSGIGLTGLNDVTDIEYISFNGLSVLTLNPTTATTGTFLETGSVELEHYNSTHTPLVNLPGDQLEISFTDLAGTYDGSAIDFNSGQTLNLDYYDASADFTTNVAVFDLDPNSGGVIIVNGVYVEQTYNLSLNSDPYDLFTGSALNYQAVLVAGHFFGPDTEYLIVGQVNAVPVPTSLLLIGSGLIGLLGFKRKSDR